MSRASSAQKLVWFIVFLVLGNAATASVWYIPFAEQVSCGFDHIQILMCYPYFLAPPGVDPIFTVTPTGEYSPIGEDWSVSFIDPYMDFISLDGPDTGDCTLYFSLWLEGDPSVDRPAMTFQAYREGIMVDNADVYAWGPGETDWAVAPGTWLVRREMPPYLAGDANRNGVVSVGDLAIMAGHWNQTGKFWAHGDFTGNGTVSLGDLAVMAGNWANDSYQHPLPAPPLGEAPEPTCLSILGVGLILLGRRRFTSAKAAGEGR